MSGESANVDEHVERKIYEDHEPRITRNEKFRYQVEGALKVIAFAAGGGIASAIILHGLGIA